MRNFKSNWRWFWLLIALILTVMVTVGCMDEAREASSGGADMAVEVMTDDPDHESAEVEMLLLPEIREAALNGEPLRVVATTSIIGDVVRQVGGEAIALTILMGQGQDPHSFEPSARDLTAVANAHVIFINGWNLEEGLVDDLGNIGEDALVVPISANIAPLAFGESEHEGESSAEAGDHAHANADPHVWFSIHNVEQWVENVSLVLSNLDPANAALFEANAGVYAEALAQLEAFTEAQLEPIPVENRFLVTNHGSFAYFAADYQFTVLGTVIPSMSTVAEPSASDLTDLIGKMAAHNLCTIFTEATLSDSLAQTVAGELDGCDEVEVVKLYTGAVGPAGSGAESYIGMYRANVAAIVAGLQ